MGTGTGACQTEAHRIWSVTPVTVSMHVCARVIMFADSEKSFL